MKRATTDDVPDITEFLNRHRASAMFPLANLDQHGLDGDAAYAPRCWLTRDPGGAVTDVLTITKSGSVLPMLPSGDYAAAASALAGREVGILIGPALQVRGLIAALGLEDASTTLDRDEPHFLLSLDRMTVPEGPGVLLPLGSGPAATIKDWMADYERGALNTPEDEIEMRVADRYIKALSRGTHMVLMDRQTPLAMTGFNAQLPEIVQIGGVYTPPDLRGRGLARRAVALHLDIARGRGVSEATLFAASDAAASAYRGIGFQRIGAWGLVVLDGTRRV